MFWRLKQFIRSRMAPIDPTLAVTWKSKLSIIYAMIGWNMLAFTFYFALKDKLPKNATSVDYAKLLGVKDATVLKYSGFQKVDEFNIRLNDEEIEEYHRANVKDTKEVETEKVGLEN